MRTLQCFEKHFPIKYETTPQKVGQFMKIFVISVIFPCCPTIQTVEFMFSNVVYIATVYRTGLLGVKIIEIFG